MRDGVMTESERDWLARQQAQRRREMIREANFAVLGERDPKRTDEKLNPRRLDTLRRLVREEIRQAGDR